MAATVRIYGQIATIDGYVWSCANKSIERLLNAMLDPLGPSGADPDPDYNAARNAVDRLGGELVSHDPPDDYIEGRIY